jgi:hypothetical protein
VNDEHLKQEALFGKALIGHLRELKWEPRVHCPTNTLHAGQSM